VLAHTQQRVVSTRNPTSTSTEFTHYSTSRGWNEIVRSSHVIREWTAAGKNVNVVGKIQEWVKIVLTSGFLFCVQHQGLYPSPQFSLMFYVSPTVRWSLFSMLLPHIFLQNREPFTLPDFRISLLVGKLF
jgi:hypothetical protein